MASSRMQVMLVALGLALANSVILLHRTAPGSAAQVTCRTPPFSQYGIRYTWPQGAQVKVNIDAFWSGSRKAAIERAFDNWEEARFANCSRHFRGGDQPPHPGGREGRLGVPAR